jgi:elongation factor 1 alpha-like protein
VVLPTLIYPVPTIFREHAILVRSLGVSQLVVAVNKLDTVDWSQQRFTDIRDKLRLFLTKQVHCFTFVSDVRWTPWTGDRRSLPT